MPPLQTPGTEPPSDLRLAPSGAAAAPEPNRAQYLALTRAADTLVGVGVLLAAFLLANLKRMPDGINDFLGMRITLKNLVMLAGFALLWRMACAAAGMYNWQWVRDGRQEIRRVLAAVTVGSTLALIFPLISKTGAFNIEAVFYFWIGASAGTILLRRLLRLATTPWPGTTKDIVIVGSGPRALKVFRDLSDDRAGYRVLGFVDSSPAVPTEIADRMLGSLEQLETLLVHRAVDEVFIALPVRSRHSEIQDAIRVCERVGVRSRYLSDVFDHVARPQGEETGRLAFTAMVIAPEDHRMVLKRWIDLVGASIILLLALPVMIMAAIAVKLTSAGPIFFVQERYGFNRRRFRMFKFRTMVVGAEQAQSALEGQNEAAGPVFKIKEDPRLTRVGKFLRRTSIDELPQLVNVLLGDMSLVGPRPLPVRDVHRFSEAALMRRFSMRPGLTCLWQISGRSNLGFDDWIKLDLRYIDEWSLGRDFLILARTVPAVLKGNGAA
jgi:exopolysaccharide biosynthesis polyprenyl glycosylphosphotransferase